MFNYDSLFFFFWQIRGWKVWEKEIIHENETLNGILVKDDNYLLLVATRLHCQHGKFRSC